MNKFASLLLVVSMVAVSSAVAETKTEKAKRYLTSALQFPVQYLKVTVTDEAGDPVTETIDGKEVKKKAYIFAEGGSRKLGWTLAAGKNLLVAGAVVAAATAVVNNKKEARAQLEELAN